MAPGHLSKPAQEIQHAERGLHQKTHCSLREHQSQKQKTHFIKVAETTTAGQGEAGRWSHRAGYHGD